MERSALRKLKLLVRVGSGCLEFQKRMAGMDSWNKHVSQISFCSVSHFANMRSWKVGGPISNSRLLRTQFAKNSRFREHRQLKGWPPRFVTTVAKSSIYDYEHALHTSRELQARLRKILNLRLEQSGGLDFHKNMDSSDKHVALVSFRQCFTFCEHI